MTEGYVVIAVSLDIKNAFNSIPWGAIMEAIENKKFPRYLAKIIDNYLRDRNIMYKTNKGRIKTEVVHAVVPQGSVLGPTLWNIAFDSVLGITILEGKIIAYADDTLILVKARDIQTVIHESNVAIAAAMNRIENLGLKVATEKSEAILFQRSRKKIPEGLEVRVGEGWVMIRDTLKYLGVILDKKLTFRQHFVYAADKTKKVMSALWRIMPNLRGPGEARRQFYAKVLHSVMLYAAPVWYDKFTAYKAPQRPIRKVQRMIALRVICRYKTVSHEAALLLARIPSFYLIAGRQKRLYERTKDLRARGEINKEDILELRHMANTILLRQWKMDISRQNIPGQRIIKALQPCLEEWVNRSNGSISFHLTQLFTAHGSFGTYLFKIRKVDTEMCPHCDEGIDDAEHTMKYCPVWRQEREELVQLVGNNLELGTLVPKMIRCEEKWRAVDIFALKVLTRKEAAERERDARRGAVIII